MTCDRTVTLSLGEDLLRAIGHAARQAGTTPSDHVRDILRAALGRDPVPFGNRDGQLRAAFDLARGWLDLQARLRRLGFTLRSGPATGLWLHTWPDNRPLCPAEAVGQTLEALMLRFGSPFPGARLSDRPAPEMLRARPGRVA